MKTLIIKGPCWQAAVKVISLDKPKAHHALQNIYSLASSHNLSLLCIPLTIDISLSTNKWSFKINDDSVSVPKTLTEIEAYIKDGKVSSLIIAGNDTEIKDNGVWTCLAGELQTQAKDPDIFRNFCEKLGFQAATKLELKVDASGIVWYADASLPWQSAAISLPLRLTPVFKKPDEFAKTQEWQISVQLNLMDETEKKTVWESLQNLVNQKENAPVFLKLNPKKTLPNLYWRHKLKNGKFSSDLFLANDGFQLLLSDNDFDSNTPHNLASLQASDIQLIGKDGDFTIRLSAGKDRNDNISLEYKFEKGSETLTLPNKMLLAFDELQLAALLRQQQTLSDPNWFPGEQDKPAKPVEPPCLWTVLRLENGWLQIPVANLSEQIYTEAELNQPLRKLTPTDSFFQGAVALSNRYELTGATGEHYWELLISNSEAFNAEFNFEKYTLTQVRLSLYEPELQLSGLLWQGRYAPTTVDLLPSLDNWLNCLNTIALRHVRKGLPLQLPINKDDLKKLIDKLNPKPLENNGIPFDSPTEKLQILQELLPLFDKTLFDKYELPISLLQGKVYLFSTDVWLIENEQDDVTAMLRYDGEHLFLYLQPAEVYPSLHQFELQDLTIRWQDKKLSLQNWTLTHKLRTELFKRLQTLKILPDFNWLMPMPIAWLSHPHLPMVQSLPLTQWQNPPNFPSANRQLFPFQAKNEMDWQIKATQSAKAWPKFSSSLQPYNNKLTMAALSLPGVELRSITDKSDQPDFLVLKAHYRHDLPYTDEVHALAQLPTNKGNTTQSLSQQRLTLEDYQQHWQSLINKARLAALDDVDAFADGENTITNIVQPYEWQEPVAIDTTSYPGSISIGLAPLFSGVESLAGIKGDFEIISEKQIKKNSTGVLKLINGSMETISSETSTRRDQRGLERKLTYWGEQLQLTELKLHLRDPIETIPLSDQIEATTLATTLRPTTLQLAGRNWKFWLKDLPLQNWVFDRNALWDKALRAMACDSDKAEAYQSQINFPYSSSKKFNHLMSYEWRLGNQPKPNQLTEPCLIFPYLAFFPLTLEKLETDDKQIINLCVQGRLQLKNNSEHWRLQENAANLVIIEFTAVDGELKLKNISLLDSFGEWLLGDDHEANNTPALLFKSLTWDAENSAIKVNDPFIRQYIHGTNWEFKLPAFSIADADKNIELSLGIPVSDNMMRFTEGSLILNLDSGSHNLNLKLEIINNLLKETERPLESDITLYTVKKGDTLWESANKFYKKGIKYPVIYYRNKNIINDPDKIYPSQKFYIPRILKYKIKDGDTFKVKNNIPGYSLKSISKFFSIESDESKELIKKFNPKLFENHNSDEKLPKSEILYLPIDESIPVPEFESEYEIFKAKLDFNWPTTGNKTNEVNLFRASRVTATDLKSEIQTGIIKLQWKTVNPNEQYFLPGMSIIADSPGLAVILFTIKEEEGERPKWQVNSLHLQSLINCRWGNLTETSKKPFSASAGNLTFDYFLHIKDAKIQKENIVVNGIAEITNLISWSGSANILTDPISISIPKAQAGTIPAHLRHRLRILFNQQPLAAELLQSGINNCLFSLAKPWQLLTVVEHQLFTVNQTSAPNSTTITNERFWCATQEVRLYMPKNFPQFIKTALDNSKVLNPTTGKIEALNKYPTGYFDKKFIELIDPVAQNADCLLVEASNCLWLKNAPITETQAFMDLQYLPGGRQRGVPTQLSDLNNWLENQWRLLFMLFLGRIQNASIDADMLDSAKAKKLNALTCDPLLLLWSGKIDDGLAQFFSHSPMDDKTIKLSAFESPTVTFLSDLDTATLEKSWLRMQTLPEHPDESTQQGNPLLTGITVTQSNDAGKFSRPAMLELLFQSVKNSYPAEFDYIQNQSDKVQRPNGLLVVSQITEPQITGWVTTLCKLHTLSAGRHLAVTLLPVEVSNENPMPLSFALSPYSAIDFVSKNDSSKTAPLFVSSELVGINAKHELIPILNRIWFKKEDETINEWAIASFNRLASNSLTGFIRHREFFDQPEAFVNYDFSFVNEETQDNLAKCFALRPKLEKLRYCEGQYGGAEMPTTNHRFEISPPQTSIKPISINGKKSVWIRTALAIDTAYATNYGMVSAAEEKIRWWHGISWKTQFLVDNLQAAGLPANYRSKAILSFLPAPSPDCLPNLPSDKHQSVLPHQFRSTLVGSRSGAFVAFRSSLISQTKSPKPTQSASIPAQHRIPRPEPLPENKKDFEIYAVQPWASHFESEQNCRFNETPSFEVFLLKDNKPMCLLLTLQTPEHGEVLSDWKSSVIFKWKSSETLSIDKQWQLTAQLTIAGHNLKSQQSIIASGNSETVNFIFNDGKPLFELSTLATGSQLQLKIEAVLVEKDKRIHSENLNLPLLINHRELLPLPLQPTFITFEDPEFNRELATVAYIETRDVLNGSTIQTLSVAADRREYNPNSTITLRYDCNNQPDTANPPDAPSANISIKRNGGTKIDSSITITSGSLVNLHLSELFENTALIAGDNLEIIFAFTVINLKLTFAIVEQPVQPAPECAYALLRKNSRLTECVRFAWGALPSRVELVCAEDLKTGVVRRRAIFEWIDCHRPGEEFIYLVQKITAGGATLKWTPLSGQIMP